MNNTSENHMKLVPINTNKTSIELDVVEYKGESKGVLTILYNKQYTDELIYETYMSANEVETMIKSLQNTYDDMVGRL